MLDFLFVCSQNLLRSPTCEHVARKRGYLAISAGTDPNAVRTVTKEDLDRCSYVVCMEEYHKEKILKIDPEFPEDRLVVWHIPDRYSYCERDLIKIVGNKLDNKGWKSKGL